MELFLVLIIAILVLRPSDAQHLAKLLGALFSIKRKWQNRTQQVLNTIEQQLTSQHNESKY